MVTATSRDSTLCLSFSALTSCGCFMRHLVVVWWRSGSLQVSKFRAALNATFEPGTTTTTVCKETRSISSFLLLPPSSFLLSYRLSVCGPETEQSWSSWFPRLLPLSSWRRRSCSSWTAAWRRIWKLTERSSRFLLAGADVVTTATYQASIPGFTEHLDVSPERAGELLRSGVRLAHEAVDRFVSEARPAGRRRPLVAASVGPYGAFLLDGSEYSGAYAEQMSVEDLKVWHRPQIEVLAAAGADLVAFETIPSIKEATALMELLREFPDARAWLSFSCKDGTRVSDGSLFTDAVQIARRSTQLVAVGVNCCSPALVEPLLDSAGSLRSPDLSWVVYPNSGEDWDSERGWVTSEKRSSLISELCLTWKQQGAALIGGCCRVAPAHIAALRQRLTGSHSDRG